MYIAHVHFIVINVQNLSYTLVNGVITHQNRKYQKSDITQHDIA